MKKILFPIAFSPNVVQNYLYALDWAKKSKATLVIMHALGYSKEDRSEIKNWEEVGSESIDLMVIFTKDNTPDEYKSVKLKYNVQIGLPVASILKIVEQEKIGLVVMGMDVDSSGVETSFSRVAMDTISRVEVPFLLIPKTNKFEEIKRMVYTFDFEFRELVILQKLMKLGGNTNTDLTCLHILESDEDMEIMDRQYEAVVSIFKNHKKFGNRIDFQMTVGTFDEMVDRWIDREKMDIMVMLSSKINFQTRFTDLITTNKISRKTEIPILVFKEAIFSKSPMRIIFTEADNN